MLPVVPIWVHIAATVAVLAVAVWRGGPLVRWIGLYNLASNNLCFVIGWAFRFSPPFEAAWAALDAAVYLAVALRADRSWTIAAASVAVVNFWTSGLHALSPVSAWAFGTAQLVWFYALNLVIVVAAWRAPSTAVSPSGRRNSALDAWFPPGRRDAARTGI